MKPDGREKLTVFTMSTVVFSRFWDWLRHLAGPETGMTLAKLRWFKRARVAKKRRSGRERKGRWSLSTWFLQPSWQILLSISSGS